MIQTTLYGRWGVGGWGSGGAVGRGSATARDEAEVAASGFGVLRFEHAVAVSKAKQIQAVVERIGAQGRASAGAVEHRGLHSVRSEQCLCEKHPGLAARVVPWNAPLNLKTRAQEELKRRQIRVRSHQFQVRDGAFSGNRLYRREQSLAEAATAVRLRHRNRKQVGGRAEVNGRQPNALPVAPG
jgi:hypothetical protein